MSGRKVDMLKLNCTPGRRLGLLVLGTLCTTLLFSGMLPAQATLSTGAIRGIVSDQAGAVLAGAKVTITDKATARMVQFLTSSYGIYLSGPLQPGDYQVRIEAKGFKTAEFVVMAHVAVISSGDLRLEPGEGQVQGEAVSVDTEQATLQLSLIHI